MQMHPFCELVDSVRLHINSSFEYNKSNEGRQYIPTSEAIERKQTQRYEWI